MLSSSLRLRLAALIPVLVAAGTAAILLWQQVPASLERSAAQQLLATLRLITPLILAGAEDARGALSAADLQPTILRLSGESSLRLSVIAIDGTVIADTAVSGEGLAELENHRTRPEVQAALLEGEGTAVRTSATTGVAYVYAAALRSTTDGKSFVLRAAEPLEELHLLRQRLTLSLLPTALAALAALAAVAFWLDRRFISPLLTLITGANRLAAGDYQTRVASPEDEHLGTLAASLNRLAARVEVEIAGAAAERDHLRTILASMSEGVLVVAADGRALSANRAFAELFSLPADVAGRGPLELTRNTELATIIERTLSGGEGQTADLELELPERRTLSLASASLGKGAGAVLVARDTTAWSRLTSMRRDFVANVSHELRTPLAAIRGYAETLRDGALEDSATAARFTDRIVVQCRRLQTLLDDLLTLSRLESIDIAALPMERIDLAPLVERASELVAGTAKERSVQIKLQLEPTPPVSGHAASLERLVVNLLENATKYNRPGGKVAVSLRQRAGSLVLEVVDTGIGIPAEALPRLFERFYRVDKGRSRDEGGTGLGLAIVKHIAQLHGGRIEVESKEGIGSTFRVVIPGVGIS